MRAKNFTYQLNNITHAAVIVRQNHHRFIAPVWAKHLLGAAITLVGINKGKHYLSANK